MIGLDALFAILDELRAEGIEMIVNPKERDAFAAGEASGTIRTVDQVRARINQLAEQQAAEEDDR